MKISNLNVHLGIQEKYLSNTLTTQEPLTEIDLDRMLRQMNLQDSIRLTSFNTADIRNTLQAMWEKNQDATEPYTMPLIVNKSVNNRLGFLHWFAAIITVDPLAHTVSYQLKDDFKVTEKQKKTLHDVLVQALAKDSVFSDWPITHGAFISNAIQKDPYSSGYRAIHNLLTDPLLTNLVDNNRLATAFSQCSTDTASLVNYVYQDQLSSLVVDEVPAANKNFREAIGQAGRYVIKDGSIAYCLEQIDAYDYQKKVVEGIESLPHAQVEKKLKEFSVFINHLTFPDIADAHLTPEDYQAFFLSLQERLVDTNSILNKLVISPCSIQAMSSVNGFFTNTETMQFNELVLELGEISDEKSDVFLATLKTLLLTLSEKNLTTLSLIDNNAMLGPEQWQELAVFVNARAITVNLLLPQAFQHTAVQRDIDRSVSNSRRKIAIASVGADIPEMQDTLQRLTNTTKKKRSRPHLDLTKNVNIDVELQQQQQVEVPIPKKNLDNDEQINADLGALEVISANRVDVFLKKLKEGHLTASGDTCAISAFDAEKIWHACFGHITQFLIKKDSGNLEGYDISKLDSDPPKNSIQRYEFFENKQLKGMTIQAADRLLQYAPQCQSGLDFKHLPTGFSLVEYPVGSDGWVLHFDKNELLFSRNLDPLAMDLKERNVPPPLAYSLAMEMISVLKIGSAREQLIAAQWQTLLEAKPYDRNAIRVFEQNLSTTMNEQPDSFSPAHLLFRLVSSNITLTEDIKFWHETLKFTNNNLNGLLAVYNELGEPGLQQLFAQWKIYQADPKAFSILESLHKGLFRQAISYMPFLSKNMGEAFVSIQGFDSAKKSWWDALLAQHVNAVGYDDLVTLEKAFKAFSMLIEEKNLTFYELPEDSFKDVKNMPVAMARMLRLLNYCDEKDLKAQWRQITQLSLHSNGAIRAMTDKPGSGFVLPEMAIDAVNYSFDQGYKGPDDPHEIGRATNIETLSRLFYRFVAYQTDRLPLAFYQDAFKALQMMPFSFEVKAELAALLASSTTGAANNAFLVNSDQPLEQWQLILDKLNNLPIHKVFKTAGKFGQLIKKTDDLDVKIRARIVESAFDLSKPPGLPIMLQLVTLIVDSIKVDKWSFDIKSILEKRMVRLTAACTELDIFTKHWQDAVYEGMKFYGDSDYEGPGDNSIFFRHIEIAKAIFYKAQDGEWVTCNQGSIPLLASLISTFRIQEDSAKQLVEELGLFENAWGEEITSHALKLLTKIDKNRSGEKSLDPQALSSFLASLAEGLKGKEGNEHFRFAPIEHSNNKQFIESVAKKELGSYFVANFFTTLDNKEIPKNTADLIADQCSIAEVNQITRILMHFNQHGDNQHYHVIVQKMLKIMASMRTDEKKNFLTNLERMELHPIKEKSVTTDIGSEIVTIYPDINQLEHLLSAILKRGNVNDFIYLLAQDDAKNTDGLMNKAILYLEQLLPAIEKNNALSKIDVLGLVTHLLLISSAESLTVESSIQRDDQLAFEKVFVYLNHLRQGVAVDINELQQVTNSLTDSKNYIQLNKLLGYLIEFNQRQSMINTSEVLDVAPEVEKSSGLFDGLMKKAFTATRNVLSGLWSGFKTSMPEISSTSSAVEIAKMPQPEVIDKILVDKALDEFEIENNRRRYYPGIFAELFQGINTMAEQFPGAKLLLIDFIHQYLSNYGTEKELLIVDAWTIVDMLQKEFAVFENDETDIIRALYYHFSQKEGEFTPKALLDLFRNESFLQFTPDNKKLLLRIVTVLLNNEKPFTSIELNALFQRCEGESGASFLAQLHTCYAYAPYPSMAEIERWYTSAIASPDGFDVAFNAFRAAYDVLPCQRESPDSTEPGIGLLNGFREEKAKQSQKKFHGVEFKDTELAALQRETFQARGRSSAQLLEELKAFPSAGDNPDYAKLVAVAAELLYRSKGKLGNSFEINTTQYLAIYSMLKSGRHVTAEIGTGEGKTRIMMISIACQFALGKTVDFVTSDVQLANRDYFEFQSYFKMLGAETNLIYADTAIDDYKQGGINFSDPSNLSLFRNKARSMGNGNKVISDAPKKRALLLDEADKTYFDAADSRFNYSTEGDDSIKGMEWIYPLLIEFFAQDDNANQLHPLESLYYKDIDACNKELKSFISSKTSIQQFKRFDALPLAQIESWQEAAITARSLKYEKDYILEADVTIVTPFGPKKVSEAKLVAGGRVSKNSKFSFGVHQCLHAHLNHVKTQRSEEEFTRLLDQAVADKLCHGIPPFTQPFSIDTEKQIIYSSNSKTLLDDYSEGSLIAVTGTAGSMIERQEAKQLYRDASEVSSEMRFISVPRHNGLFRNDKPVRLTANSSDQINALVEYILEARRNHQPALVICENDSESRLMYEALEKHLIFKKPQGSIQRIDSQLSLTNEQACINKAGIPGMVTVSTGMIGRGTDIKLQDKAKEKGLRILLTYLPRPRDMQQILGRSGRFGDKGDTRLILNKEELKQRLGKVTLKDGFYAAPERYLIKQQALMDRKNQCERLIKIAMSDFSRKITDNFFEDFLPQVAISQRMELYPCWMKFIKESDQVRNSISQTIFSEMEANNPNVDKINSDLSEFKNKIQAEWSDLLRSIADKSLVNQNPGRENPIVLLKKELDELVLDDNTIKLIQNNGPKQHSKTITIHTRYDKAHDGLATIYNKPFVELVATLKGERRLFANFRAWREGHGILFPNLRAWWQGEMSLRQYILGFSSKETPSGGEHTEENIDDDIQNSEGSYTVLMGGLGVEKLSINEPVGNDPANIKGRERKNTGALSSEVENLPGNKIN